jgi:spore coat polysaccharide biosynthesis predicted glycosyltransferase SpsG
MRCLTLARAFRAAGREPLFVTAVGAEYVGSKKIGSFGFTSVAAGGPAGTEGDLNSLLPRLRSQGAPLLVADNRNLGTQYLSACREAARIVYLDDDVAWAPPVDVLVNGKPGIVPHDYPCGERGPLFLVGPEYNLVRDEFFSISPSRGSGKLRLLITLGGEDPLNHTAWVIHHAAGILQTVEVAVIVGPAHPDPAGVVAAAEQCCPQARVLSDVHDMAEVFAETDLAITAGGTTCYELAAAGIPALAIVTEDHQWNLVRPLAAAGSLEILGDQRRIDAAALNQRLQRVIDSQESRTAFAAAGKKLFPAPGAKRIVEKIGEFCRTRGNAREH